MYIFLPYLCENANNSLIMKYIYGMAELRSAALAQLHKDKETRLKI